MRTGLEKFYNRKKILVTGGGGFIGLNISRSLLELGAEVTIMSRSFLPPSLHWMCENAGSTPNIIIADIRDEEKVKNAVQGIDILFNLAGKSGAVESNQFPMQDLDINCKGHLTILEACRFLNPRVSIIFSSSRLVYGKPLFLPVNERHPLIPESIYATHKLTAENYHLIYGRLYGLKTTVLRISNPYGPGQANHARGYSIANKFISNVVKGEKITIFGEGEQRRDYLYISDLVNALLIAGFMDEARGKIYNIGGDRTFSLLEFAELIVKLAGKGDIEKIPWPDNYSSVETGDYQSDIELAKKELEWAPLVDPNEGIVKTIEFYRSIS